MTNALTPEIPGAQFLSENHLRDLVETLKAENDALRERIAELENPIFTDTNPEAQWAEDIERACPHCGGSGHKDDVSPTPTEPDRKPRHVPVVGANEVDAEKVKELRDQFHKTGSIEDAAKLMRYLGQ